MSKSVRRTGWKVQSFTGPPQLINPISNGLAIFLDEIICSVEETIYGPFIATKLRPESYLVS